jgi:hypothetical protein
MLSNLIGPRSEHLYEVWDARAMAMLERLKSPHGVHVGAVFQLSRCHRLHANYLILRGESDRARQELEADLEFVRSVPAAETAFPEFAISEALSLAALGRWPDDFTPVRSLLRMPPSYRIENDGLEVGIAELTARRFGWLPSIGKSPWLIPDDLTNEAWADRVILSIKSDAAEFGLDHVHISKIGWRMRHSCLSTLGWKRQAGRLSDARRTADQLLALAERLARSYPDQAANYMLLSEGYVQNAKNAYRNDDEPTVERWERKALDAAIHAATVEPENAEARSLVQDRRARLNKLTSK